MSLITVHTDKVASSLPIATPYSEIIRETPGLRAWWRVQLESLTLSGSLIQQIEPIAGAAGLPLVQHSTTPVPEYVSSAFGGRYPAAHFYGGRTLRTMERPYILDEPFTWVFMGRVAPSPSNQSLAGVFSASSNSTRIQVDGTTSDILFQHGNGTARLDASVEGGNFDTPLCIICTSDMSTLKIRVNRLDGLSGATDNVQGANAFVIGAANAAGTTQPSDSKLSDFIVIQRDISGDADLISAIEGYAAQAYPY